MKIMAKNLLSILFILSIHFSCNQVTKETGREVCVSGTEKCHTDEIWTQCNLGDGFACVSYQGDEVYYSWDHQGHTGGEVRMDMVELTPEQLCEEGYTTANQSSILFKYDATIIEAIEGTGKVTLEVELFGSNNCDFTDNNLEMIVMEWYQNVSYEDGYNSCGEAIAEIEVGDSMYKIWDCGDDWGWGNGNVGPRYRIMRKDPRLKGTLDLMPIFNWLKNHHELTPRHITGLSFDVIGKPQSKGKLKSTITTIDFVQ